MVIDARSVYFGQLTAEFLQHTCRFYGGQCHQCAVLYGNQYCVSVGISLRCTPGVRSVASRVSSVAVLGLPPSSRVRVSKLSIRVCLVSSTCPVPAIIQSCCAGITCHHSNYFNPSMLEAFCHFIAGQSLVFNDIDYETRNRQLADSNIRSR
jgi:hypothetical protein